MIKQLDFKNQYIIKLQQHIQYNFKNILLLKRALTHRSYSSDNYERLEFIGDSILNYAIAKMLFDKEPRLQEGALSQMRANLVNQETLAEIALNIGLNNALFLGPGEIKTGGDRRPSILADAMEAIFAAISLDSNFSTAERIIRNLYITRVGRIDASEDVNNSKNPKSLLQEILQFNKLDLPKYRCVGVKGDSPNQTFSVQCEVLLDDFVLTRMAEGRSKKNAEQNVAKLMVDAILEDAENYKIELKKI